MRDAILRKANESAKTTLDFFAEHAELLDRCVREMAERFRVGGKLYVMGNGGSACDADHVAVEFSHPIIEKRRAIPAVSLSHDSAFITAVGNDSDFSRIYAVKLESLALPQDVALGISTSGASANVNRALQLARRMGLLTVGFAGRDGGAMVDVCDFCFVVPSWSIHRIQETHTVLLHLLWDQLHVAMGEDDVL